jgi:periplasmic protein TonB
VTTCRIEKPNWLLGGLVIISLLAHALALGHMTGLYKPKTADYIELEMRTEEKQFKRTIPMPPQRKKSTMHSNREPIKPILSMPVEKPNAPPKAPRTSTPRPSVVEPIPMPQRPNMSKPKPLAWKPAFNKPDAVITSETTSSGYGSLEDYFSMVRMMIENHKQYPHGALMRRAEGRVVVRFVLLADGNVRDISVVKSSRNKLLDEAALAAVRESLPFPRPPKKLFVVPISLEVSVVFELV